MLNIRWLIALITAVHRFLYRVTKGRVGAGSGGRKFLLLTHVGRKTGRLRVTPLLYVEDGDHWVVIGSNAGDDRHPAWWLNLQSHPSAKVQVGGSHFAVRARAATAEESKRLWPKFIAAYKNYVTYRARTTRTIPIVILEKTSSS